MTKPFLLLLATLACTACAAQQVAGTPALTVTLEGTIRDSVSGNPLPGIYLWPYFRSTGLVTDSLGHYRLKVSGWRVTLLVRACSIDSNLAVIDTVLPHGATNIQRDVTLARSPFPCIGMSRPPWATDASDSTIFEGFNIYSWEGGGWLTECNGQAHRMDWGSHRWDMLDRYSAKEGQRTYVRARGRFVEDRIVYPSKPGRVVVKDFRGALFLPDTILEVRPLRKTDCGGRALKMAQ